MRVLIAATAVRMGGALQHLGGLLPALAEIAPDHRWLVVTNPGTAAALPCLPGRVAVERQATERLDAVRRLWVEQRLLAERARDFGADLVLSFNSFALRAAPCPQVLVAANALYVCGEYWRRVAASGVAERGSAWLRAALLGWSLRRAEVVLAPSRWMADALRGRFDLGPDGVRVVHHGVNPRFLEAGARRALQPPQPVRRVLAASRHGINKDFATLVRALALLAERGSRDLCVQLTGTPTESRYAQATARLVADLGLDGRVAFTGEPSPDQLVDLYRQADLFVFPSWCESFGLPQVEAAASGLPVIAPDLLVSRELLADAARYYRPLDPPSLADALADLMSRHESARDLAQRAVGRAQTFTWPRAAEATLAVLHSAASSRPVAAP